MHYFGRDMGWAFAPNFTKFVVVKTHGVFSADVTHDSDAKKLNYQLKERCKKDGVFSKLKQQFWLPKWWTISCQICVEASRNLELKKQNKKKTKKQYWSTKQRHHFRLSVHRNIFPHNSSVREYFWGCSGYIKFVCVQYIFITYVHVIVLALSCW